MQLSKAVAICKSWYVHLRYFDKLCKAYWTKYLSTMRQQISGVNAALLLWMFSGCSGNCCGARERSVASAAGVGMGFALRLVWSRPPQPHHLEGPGCPQCRYLIKVMALNAMCPLSFISHYNLQPLFDVYHFSIAAEGFSPENAIHFPRYPQKWRDEFCSIWLEFHLQVKMSRKCSLLTRTCSLSWLSGNIVYQMVSPGQVWGNESVQSDIFDPATGERLSEGLKDSAWLCLPLFLVPHWIYKTWAKRFGSIMFVHTAIPIMSYLIHIYLVNCLQSS